MPENELVPIDRVLIKTLYPIFIARELNRIARECQASGWKVRRGILGTVILELKGGEVHYIPTPRGIEQVTFERRMPHE